jgi:hypothetical protein
MVDFTRIIVTNKFFHDDKVTDLDVTNDFHYTRLRDLIMLLIPKASKNNWTFYITAELKRTGQILFNGGRGQKSDVVDMALVRRILQDMGKYLNLGNNDQAFIESVRLSAECLLLAFQLVDKTKVFPDTFELSPENMVRMNEKLTCSEEPTDVNSVPDEVVLDPDEVVPGPDEVVLEPDDDLLRSMHVKFNDRNTARERKLERRLERERSRIQRANEQMRILRTAHDEDVHREKASFNKRVTTQKELNRATKRHRNEASDPLQRKVNDDANVRMAARSEALTDLANRVMPLGAKLTSMRHIGNEVIVRMASI